jgi:CDP-6-deoxy-D-xylo-4-hexulose-3-dehydrase
MKKKKLISDFKNWPLQENVLRNTEKIKLTKYILKNNRFTQFEKVRNFENLYANWQKCKYSIFVNSGSSANLLIIQVAKELYNWNNQDEIIVPALTWPTTVTPVIQSNLKPVFVDCNLEDFSYDYNELKKKITDKTKAIFVAHIIGFPSNINNIKKIIGNKNIKIFEDACESQGAKFQKKKVGNFGVASSFSFYWGHHLTTIEGGMICTNSEKFYNLCLLKRSHGLARELPLKFHRNIAKKNKDINFKFLFLSSGFNLRSTEINAYLGLIQLPKLNKWIKIRNKNYKSFYKVCKKYRKHLIITNNSGISSFVLPFIFKKKELKKKFSKILSENNIENRPFIAGNLLKQPFLEKFYNKNFKNADFLHNNALYIGNNQFVGIKNIKRINLILKNFFNEEN